MQRYKEFAKTKRETKRFFTKTLIFVGSKESNIMKRSAEILHKKIANSSLEVLPGYYHGDLSLNHPELYIQKILSLLTN